MLYQNKITTTNEEAHTFRNSDTNEQKKIQNPKVDPAPRRVHSNGYENFWCGKVILGYYTSLPKILRMLLR